MKSYEVQKGRMRHYLMVRPAEIIVGSTAGSGHTDNAGSCTHAEFLGGTYNDEVERTFGADVLQTVRAACVDATDDPHFGARGRERELLEAWATLDRDEDLAPVAETPDENGRDSLITGTARVSSGGTTLTLTGARGRFEPSGAEIELDGDASGVIAWDGRFYVTDRWHAHVFDASGVRIASTADLPKRFDVSNAVRISWPVRKGEVVGFTFSTISSASSPTRQALGEVAVLVLSDNSEITRWSPYSRTVATEHRRRTL